MERGYNFNETDLEKNSANNFSERIFFKIGDNNLDKLSELRSDLLGANMDILVQNYFSKMIFFTGISLVLSILLGLGLLIAGVNITILFFITLFIPLTCFIIFYSYPSLKRGSFEKKIGEEIPFATIYMAAIASSDLEPTKMFRLIANSKEYPAIGKEMKKVINQIDLYGYNLATALTNVSKGIKNERLSELFSGISINITSGGSLKNYLEKKADNLLVDYKLDRQKYNSVAETFMDVYISLLITAPLILMIVFVVMSMTGFDIGIGIGMLNIIIIVFVSLLNIIFLAILQVKQPKN
jgi:archaeal flagellar protein FlaJ